MNRTILTFIAMSLLATVATAADGPSVNRGKELFTSTQLGTNGKSCAGCHPDGKGLENAAAFDEKKLVKVTNMCIEKALKGTALPDNSSDLSSLIMYQKTIGATTAK